MTKKKPLGKCSKSIYRGYRAYVCTRDAVVERKMGVLGDRTKVKRAYCTQHDPVRIAIREAAKENARMVLRTQEREAENRNIRRERAVERLVAYMMASEKAQFDRTIIHYLKAIERNTDGT